MKHIILLIGSLWIGSTVLAQSTTIRKDTLPVPKAAGLKFEDVNHNFGDVLEGQKLSYNFLYKNTGPDTLRIKKIDCGKVCMVTDKYDSVIAPGQTGSINVVFDTDNKLGYVVKKLVILYNTVGQETQVTLNVAANVIVKM